MPDTVLDTEEATGIKMDTYMGLPGYWGNEGMDLLVTSVKAV